MAGTAKRRATYADLMRVPDHMVAEILGGVLHTSPRPAPPHATSATVLGGALNYGFHRPPGRGGPGGWWILYEPELHLGREVVVPDVAGWRRQRLPRLPREAYFRVAPDWVCEVISRSTATIDRVLKMRIYLRAKVRHVWIVEPVLRTLEIYRHAGNHWTLVANHGGDARVRAEPFAELELELDRWWVPDDAEPRRRRPSRRRSR